MTNTMASTLVSHKGIRLVKVQIEGDLDLRDAIVRFPFIAFGCSFTGEVRLTYSRFPSISFSKCEFSIFNATGAQIEGGAAIHDGSSAKQIGFSGATIGGDLDLSDFKVTNPEKIAISLSSVKIGRSANFNALSVSGTIAFDRAEIDGGVFLDDCKLSSPNSLALIADGIKVGGAFTCRRSTIDGALQLRRGHVGNNFEADGTRISNVNNVALDIDGTRIEGSLFLRAGFNSDGLVKLAGCAIRLELDCNSSTFKNSKDRAIDCENLSVGTNAHFNNQFVAEGQIPVFLNHATVKGDIECIESQFLSTGDFAILAEDLEVGSKLVIMNSRCKGRIHLAGANLRNAFFYRDLIDPGEAQLDLTSARTGTLSDTPLSWPPQGCLFLDGFVYTRLFSTTVDSTARLKWLGLQINASLPQPYDQLAAVLRTMGHNTEARKILIGKNRAQARVTRTFRQSWWWHNVFGRLIGYGYAPWRAFVLSLLVIAFGWVIFGVAHRRGLMSVTTPSAYLATANGKLDLDKRGRPKLIPEYPPFNAFAYSIESFTPFLNLGQREHWGPNRVRETTNSSKIRREGSLLCFIRIYLIFHVMSGWLLTSLWVGAITGLVKT